MSCISQARRREGRVPPITKNVLFVVWMKKGLKMQSLASLTSLTALETNQIKYDLLLFIHMFLMVEECEVS